MPITTQFGSPALIPGTVTDELPLLSAYAIDIICIRLVPEKPAAWAHAAIWLNDSVSGESLSGQVPVDWVPIVICVVAEYTLFGGTSLSVTW
jgi:hypothetical protein